ncbi:MAG: hypothetical protein GX134_07555 [candidate division WS1 bacterium]|jgi:DNA-directed RNA polymerase specialized sigma24 family protein|nr:hypothetical protein [candidate division WS1 bacterium]
MAVAPRNPKLDPADEALADGILADEQGAQDALTQRLRPMLERLCARLADPDDADDLVALVLYQILQAEERLMSAWDRRSPLDVYLAVASARSCVEEHRRFQIIRAVGVDTPRPEADTDHPCEADLARWLSSCADPAVAAHAERCRRCARRVALARCALGEE